MVEMAEGRKRVLASRRSSASTRGSMACASIKINKMKRKDARWLDERFRFLD